MVRKILAGLTGIILAAIIVYVFQAVNLLIFGAPSVQNMEQLRNYIAGLPVAAFVIVLVGYVIAYFVAGFVMAKIARWDSLVLPLVLGVLGTLGWIVNITTFPHPFWMAVLGFLCFIPFSLLGYRTGDPKNEKSDTQA